MIDLCCAPPEFVEHKGRRYEIRTDFKIWIQLEKLMASNLAMEEKVVKMLSLCYVKELPPSFEVALLLLSDFYCAGIEQDAQGEKLGAESTRLYDFTYDAELFYAAFLEQYGIDLISSDLHWWKFLALFRSLSQNTRLFSVLSWRAADLSDISDERQKEYIRKMKRLYRLPKAKSAFSDDSEIAELISAI